jgi:DNA-binding GntR family transcriptional regulator
MRVACLARDFALIAEFDIEFHRSIVRRAHEKELESIWSSIVGRGFRGHTYLCFGLGHRRQKWQARSVVPSALQDLQGSRWTAHGMCLLP